MGRHQRGITGFLCDVFGQLQQDRTGPFLFGNPERLSHQRGNGIPINNLPRHFADGTKQAHHIDDLKLSLFRFLDRLLTGNHQQRKPAKVRVRRRRCEISGAWAEGGHTHARPPGQTAVGGCHERRTLLVAGEDQTD